MRAFRRARVAVFLGVRSLIRGNVGVTAMSITMVTAVFVSVMFLPSLITGASNALNRQLVDTLTGDLSIVPDGRTVIDDASGYLDEIRATEGVAAATGIRRVGNEIAAGGASLAQGIDAIDPISYAQVFTSPAHLIEGRFLEPDDLDGIVLGVGVAGADRTEVRSYSSSLKTVHVDDEVEVSMIGGETRAFVVRGIYQNDFALSDQGAYITIAAADALIPDTSLADQVRFSFDAVDQMAAALSAAAAQAASLADGADTVATAAEGLASGARSLAGSAGSVETGAAQLASDASSLAAAAASLAGAAGDLADGLDRTATGVAAPAAQAAAANAASASQLAEGAATVAAGCPTSADPAYCAATAQLAADATALATAAAAASQAAQGTADAVAASAQTAAGLADHVAALAGSAGALADAAAGLAAGTVDLADGASGVADASGQLASQIAGVADGAGDLAAALRDAAIGADSGEPDARNDILESLDSASAPPGAEAATRIVVRTGAGVEPETVVAELEPLRTDVAFQDPGQLAAAIQDQLDTFELIDDIMRVISLMVAAITVLIITYVDLSNRRRQIGIERAIGIRSSSIVGSYVLKSVITAFIGIALGWLLFRFVLMPIVDRYPFVFPTGPVTLELTAQTVRENILILLVVAALSAMLPAVHTVRMRILDAIWG